MPVVISMLRGVNVGGYNKIKMDALRELCESIGLRQPQTYIQSGNVVFKTEKRNLLQLSERIESEIHRSFGFRPSLILRTLSELKEVVAKNPFATRTDIHPSKLLVTFLASDPGQEARERILRINADPEELWIENRELYIYFPNGMARPKLSPTVIEKVLQTSGTGRNWNTVMKLLELAQQLERSS